MGLISRLQRLRTTIVVTSIGMTLAVAGAVFAASVEPIHIEESDANAARCSELNESWTEFKIDHDAVDGEYTDGTLIVTISGSNNVDPDNHFSWASNIGVDAVIVKDGNSGSNAYVYDPESVGDTDLRTPFNGLQGISHINFCYDGGDGGPEASEPTISKDAAGTYDNTFTWTIDKSVDKTIIKKFGGIATFNYTISVLHDAGAISNVNVAGSIEVTNPNQVNIDIDGVTDVLSPNNIECTVTGGGAQTLTPGAHSFPYSCDLGDSLPEGALTNIATVAWTAQALSDGSTLNDGEASTLPPVPVSFTGNDIDECVTVDDTYAGGPQDVQVCVGDDPTSITYSRDIPIPANDCLDYDNTATFSAASGASGSDSQIVTVCGPVKTGARTMGFWQNPNGQSIIKGGTSTLTACNSGRWLRGDVAGPFDGKPGPFKDLTSGANCTTVAKYVTDVIKAADAGGSTMNKMLKGQMLATSLDVFFSDPALGGNKLLAPGPIGNVNVDLTMICKNIALCTVIENVSSAFGGATSKTVSAMLRYAATQTTTSNGSTWYGNVKSVQELAKDAFDAINNGKVFTA